MFDLVILGSGSAAFAAALKASDHGAKVAMVERGTLGGTCVNVGCVPSKNLLHAGELGYYDSHRDFPGISPGRTTLEFNKIIEQKNQIVRGLRKEKYSDVLRSLPSTKLFRGDARFASKTRVKVDGINVEGKKFVIATGSSPRIPSVPGIEKVDYLTNVEALSLREKPASMVVIGGRALGLEFAQMYAHMGTQVTVLQRGERIIPEEEPVVSDALRYYLEEEGISIKTGVQVKRVYESDGEKRVVASADGREFEAKGEQILNPLHYLVMLERRPAALDHANVYRHWQLPAVFGELRADLERQHGPAAGARQYIRVLQLLAEHPLERVQRAIEESRAGSGFAVTAIAPRTSRLAERSLPALTEGECQPFVSAVSDQCQAIVNMVHVPVPNLHQFDQLLCQQEVTHVRDQCLIGESQPETTAPARYACRV